MYESCIYRTYLHNVPFHDLYLGKIMTLLKYFLGNDSVIGIPLIILLRFKMLLFVYNVTFSFYSHQSRAKFAAEHLSELNEDVAGDFVDEVKLVL